MRSMTAYANVYKKANSHSLQLVIRSLNFKYLDINIHYLPPENILLEEKIKKEVRKVINRGKIELYVFLKGHQQRKIHIEERAISDYISQMKKLAKKYNLNPDLNISSFLNLPQVIWWEDSSVGDSLILSSVKEGLDKLMEFKDKEGRVIQKEILKNLKKLQENVKNISENKPGIGQEENNKEDIDEEISLMGFYLNKLEKKVNADDKETKGKSIDFLTQEILRELNASSSKTRNRIAASLIVESKNYLERIREQAQNIE